MTSHPAVLKTLPAFAGTTNQAKAEHDAEVAIAR
jgi:hypothetical protein